MDKISTADMIIMMIEREKMFLKLENPTPSQIREFAEYQRRFMDNLEEREPEFYRTPALDEVYDLPELKEG